MKLTWKRKDLDADIDFILFHQMDDTPKWWRDQLFKAYPALDAEYCRSVPQDVRHAYIRREMHKQAKIRQSVIDKSIAEYASHWAPIAERLNAAYSATFGENCDYILNDMQACVGLNPICPRDLQNHTFDIYHYFAPEYAVEMAIHEITHLVWFYFWNLYFKDDASEYDFPNIKWLLSEIVVETIIRNSEIGGLIPDLNSHKYIAYSYFYNMKIQNRPLFDIMRDLFMCRKSMREFMEQAFDFVIKNEPELRTKIAVAEK